MFTAKRNVAGSSPANRSPSRCPSPDSPAFPAVTRSRAATVRPQDNLVEIDSPRETRKARADGSFCEHARQSSNLRPLAPEAKYTGHLRDVAGHWLRGLAGVWFPGLPARARVRLRPSCDGAAPTGCANAG